MARKKASKKKTPKRRAKKARGAKLKGNYRLPTLAAAKRYLKQWKKFSAEKKAKETVQIHYNEARTIVQKATSEKPKKTKLSKKKGRGNFKLTTPKQARAYIRRVSAQQPLSKLKRHPFKPRVAECVHHLGREEVDALIAAGQEAMARTEKRKAEAATKQKRARKKRLQAQAKRIQGQINKIEKNLSKSQARYDGKLKAAKARLDAAQRKAAAARKKLRRKKK